MIFSSLLISLIGFALSVGLNSNGKKILTSLTMRIRIKKKGLYSGIVAVDRLLYYFTICSVREEKKISNLLFNIYLVNSLE